MVSESALAALALYATDALAHRKLTPGGFLLLLAGWVVAQVLAMAARRRGWGGAWGPVLIEIFLPALWLAVSSPWLKEAWTAPQVAYASGLTFCLWQLWRRAACGPAEVWRLLAVVATAVFVTAPFFTDLQLGGRDAKWYSSVFIDFIGQLRAGVFPVFLGQGELSYNGSANLFRSAPLCLWIGGVWDWLTWQSLPPVAIRNLAVISAALGAGLGMYFALVRLIPPAQPAPLLRWVAAAFAGLYLLCPAMLVSLYFYELQMTWTALLALPWVFYGNVRAIQDPAGRGYVPLAAGLSLAWLAHAPLAIVSTMATAALQLGHLCFSPGAFTAKWRAAARGAGLFALLSAYYFLGMSELPANGVGSLPREAGFMIAVILCIVSAVQVMLWGRAVWLAAMAAGAGLLGWLAPAWVGWALAWFGLWGAMCLWLRRWLMEREQRAVVLATLGLLGAAILAPRWVAAWGFVPDDMMSREVAQMTVARAELLLPLGKDLSRPGAVQPGYAVWLVFALVFAGAMRARSIVPALVASVLALLLMLCLTLPGLAEFVAGFAPLQIGHAMNFPMLYRLVPVMVCLGLFGGFVVLLESGARWRAGFAWMLAAGLVWSVAQAGPVVRTGFSRVLARGVTERLFHPDSYALGRYPYNLLFTPLHYMDGRRPPWMECRLLTPHYDMLAGPEEVARDAEARHVQTHPLTSRVDDTYPQWLQFSPEWEVQPGETLLLRFEFDAAFNPHGWLIMSSQNGYQEHLLDPDFGGAGFGAGPIASRVLAVTNTGPLTEHYTMSMKMEAGNTLPRDGGVWGRLHISRYDPDKAPVKLESLVPFQARVTISEDGFLETPRQWIAGYRAWVDGKRVETEPMKSGMLGLRLKAGTHRVVIEFAGSRRLWLGLLLSAGTALLLATSPIWRDPRRRENLRLCVSSWLQTNRT